MAGTTPRTLPTILLLLACAAWPRAGAAEPAPMLSLREAVAEALANNDRVLDARDGVEQAGLSLRVARASFRPRIVPNVFGSFGEPDLSNQTYNLRVSQRFPTGTELRADVGAVSQQNQFGTFYNGDTTLRLSQPLLRGFGRELAMRGVRRAEAGVAETGRRRSLLEAQLAVDVAAAYYQIVAQRRLLGVGEKSLESARQLLAASEAKLAVGKVSRLDVLRAEQLVARTEGEVLDASAALEDANDQLRQLLGRGLDFRFAVETAIPRRTEDVSAEDAVNLALERRMETASARAALEEAEREAAAARNRLLPQLDLDLALTRRETADSLGASFGLDKFRTAVFLGVSTPVDRTPERLEHHTRLIERDRRRRELEAARRRIAVEARRAVRQQERQLRSLEVAEARERLAESEVDVAALRFRRGLSNNLDVVNAELNLLAARSHRIATLAGLAVARLRLRATLGILDPRSDFEEVNEPT